MRLGSLERSGHGGDDGGRERVADHLHVLGCEQVGCRSGCRITGALGIHDRLGGEHVVGDERGRGRPRAGRSRPRGTPRTGARRSVVRSVTALSCLAWSLVATPVV